MAREPAALVLTHLAWHRAAGATALHLYLDDPADPVAEAAARIPGVRVTRCDPGFWASLPPGRRPGLITVRQGLCATHAYGQGGVDWLLHLDADEFLLPTAPLEPALAANADLDGALVVPVRERVLTRPDPASLFEGLFRRPLRGAERNHPLLAPIRDMAPAGMIGHTLGKSLSRTGRGLSLRPHFPRGAGGEEVPTRPLAAAVLLHFDGLTPLHWLAKMLARLPAEGGAAPASYLGPHRQAQLAALTECRRDPARLRALHDRLRVIADPAPHLAAGLIEDHAFDPLPACRALLGDAPDLSVAGFDAGLRASRGALLAGL